MESKLATGGVSGAALSGLVIALAAIHSGAVRELLKHPEKVAIRLPGRAREDQASMRMPLAAGLQQAHQGVRYRDGSFFFVFGSEAQVKFFPHHERPAVEVHIAPGCDHRFLLPYSGA